MQCGCDKVVVVLTKPESVPRTSERDCKLAKLIRRRYPAAAEKLCRRAETYNAGVAAARAYAGQGRALIVSPDDTCGVDTLCRDSTALKKLYAKGYDDGGGIAAFLAAP